jgi:cysteine desulfurase
MLYFDHNATTPLLPQARQAWVEASERFIGNPSSPHRLGARADAALQEARERLAGVLGCGPADIVWTSGATESNNTVLHHFARTLPTDAQVWVSAIEHPSVLEAAAFHFSKRTRHIPANRAGVIDLDWLTGQLAHDRPGLVAVMAANNETGVLQPWREALAICRQWRVPFFCDAAQWIGKLPARGLGECDFVSGCAHKFGGPKGVGFLKCPSRNPLTPLLFGGPQEERRRAGTENVAGVLSMLAALEAREKLLAAEAQEARLAWRQDFETRLLKQLPGGEIVGAGAERLWNTVSALMPEADCQQRWVVKLDRLGYAVSTGSACASGKEEPSHVLRAMGYSSSEAGRMLRFSSGWETTLADWSALLDGLVKVQCLLGVAVPETANG